MAVCFIGEGNRRKPQTCSKSLTNLSHNVVSSTPHLSGIWTHNVSGDRHWIQLSYDPDGPAVMNNHLSVTAYERNEGFTSCICILFPTFWCLAPLICAAYASAPVQVTSQSSHRSWFWPRGVDEEELGVPVCDFMAASFFLCFCPSKCSLYVCNQNTSTHLGTPFYDVYYWVFN